MAIWSALKNNWTPVAVADATNFTDAGYVALQGGSASQRQEVQEVMIEGLAGAAAPSQLVFARDSTVGATALTGVLLSSFDPDTAALAAPPLTFSASTTKPQRSATLHLLSLSFQAFGGLVRWVAADDRQRIRQRGNAVSAGELSLSHLSTGTPGLISSHIIFEPF